MDKLKYVSLWNECLKKRPPSLQIDKLNLLKAQILELEIEGEFRWEQVCLGKVEGFVITSRRLWYFKTIC